MNILYSTIDRYTIGYDIYNNGTPFVLNMPVRFWVYDRAKNYKITVPEDFQSDGATVTFKLAEIIIGCGHCPLFFPAVLIHDYMCVHKESYERNFASRVMLKLLLTRGAPKWKAHLMYWAVEIYQKYWEKWR